jgi:uncharacterized membrane protein
MLNKVKEHFLKNKPRYFLFIIAILLFLSCCFVSKDVRVNESKTVRTIQSEEFHSLTKYGYSAQDTGKGIVYTPINQDPQVLIALEPIAINKVKINFKDEYTGRIQVYYSEDMNLTENNSWFVGGIGDKSVCAVIPTGNYNLIRIDIESSFKIKSLEFISEELVLSVGFNFVPFIIFSLILILLAVLEKRVGFFAFIKEKCLSWYGEALGFFRERRFVSFSFKILSTLLTVGFFATVAILGMLGGFVKSARLAVAVIAFLALLANLVYHALLKNSSRAVIFLLVLAIVTTAFAFIMPQKSGTSWDDQIHYQRIVYLKAALFDVSPNEYDYNQVAMRLGSILEDQSEYSMFYSSRRAMDIGVFGVNTATDFSIILAFISYIPLVIILIVSNSLGASYIFSVFLAKAFNVVLFVLFMYLSLRKLKSGQLLFASVCMLPTLIFSVPQISYDIWVFTFISYAFALFISEMQTPDKKISLKTVIIMLLSIIVGCLPKKVYFLLMLPMAFMPASKFSSKRFARIYRIACVALMLIIMLSFMLPFASDIGGLSDNRGGEGVDSAGQVDFVLSNPIKYAGILINFLIEYVAIGYSARYSGYFAYLGFAPSLVGTVSIIIMLFCAFADKSEHDRFKGSLINRLVIMVSAAATLAVVASALYVSFTPVGHYTVNGCQWRYIFPVLFPGLYAIGSVKISNKINERWLNFIILGALAFNSLVPFVQYCI